MESIRALYRIGMGPSSSHTMAPRRAAGEFRQRHVAAARFRVTLYGSLAATGRGHLTDRALLDAMAPTPVDIVWRPDEELPVHPNGMRFEALDPSGAVAETWEVSSVGGGALRDALSPPAPAAYPLSSLSDILARCEREGAALWEYVGECEGAEIWEFLGDVWRVMQAALDRGLSAEGRLPGGLGLPRKARSLRRKALLYRAPLRASGLLAAYAIAVAEENAAGGTVVTAPTCGSSGVVPAVVRFLAEVLDATATDIVRALATAGLIGALIKENASISGAMIGCQGEIGAACAMAAAAGTQLYGGTIRQIEYAAEMGIEHHLGLTCDPVAGLVQIPCIERNASAAARALGAAHYALLSDGIHLVPFDDVVAVMRETGQALPSLYRETGAGGLARAYARRKTTGRAPD